MLSAASAGAPLAFGHCGAYVAGAGGRLRAGDDLSARAARAEIIDRWQQVKDDRLRRSWLDLRPSRRSSVRDHRRRRPLRNRTFTVATAKHPLRRRRCSEKRFGSACDRRAECTTHAGVPRVVPLSVLDVRADGGGTLSRSGTCASTAVRAWPPATSRRVRSFPDPRLLTRAPRAVGEGFGR